MLIGAGEKTTLWELDLAAKKRVSEKIMMQLIDSAKSIDLSLILNDADYNSGPIWYICARGFTDTFTLLLSKLGRKDSIKLIDFYINWANKDNNPYIFTESVEKNIDAITMVGKVALTQEQSLAICDLQKRIKEAKKEKSRIMDTSTSHIASPKITTHWNCTQMARRRNRPF